MKIWIDGKSRPIDTTNIRNVEELLSYVEKECIEPRRIITRVILNDVVLDEGQKIGLGAFPIGDVVSLSVETDDSLKLAYDMLEEAQEYLPLLSMLLEEAAARIREGELREGLQEAGDAIEFIEAFIVVLNSIREAFKIDFSKLQYEEFTALDKERELSDISKKILDAAQNQDWTLFADLMEYELSPLLYEWMAIIPELVSLLPELEEEN